MIVSFFGSKTNFLHKKITLENETTAEVPVRWLIHGNTFIDLNIFKSLNIRFEEKLLYLIFSGSFKSLFELANNWRPLTLSKKFFSYLPFIFKVTHNYSLSHNKIITYSQVSPFCFSVQKRKSFLHCPFTQFIYRTINPSPLP